MNKTYKYTRWVKCTNLNMKSIFVFSVNKQLVGPFVVGLPLECRPKKCVGQTCVGLLYHIRLLCNLDRADIFERTDCNRRPYVRHVASIP